jgi:hypothetical protein
LNEAIIAAMTFGLLAWLAHYAIGGSALVTGYAVLGLLGVVAASRAFRIRIETRDDQVRVLNYWKTFTFAWTDVMTVSLGSLTQGPLLQPALVFNLRGGRAIHAQATPRNPEQLQKMLHELASCGPGSITWPDDLA